MSTEQDTTRIVRSWLEEGVTALPDRVLDTVLDQLPATPQRRSSWPTWRFAQMTRLAQGAIAAAVVVVVVLGVVSLNLIPRSNVGGPAVPSPSPAPIPSAAPSAAPTAGLMPVGSTAVALPAGPYVAGAPFPLTVAFTVPSGWQGNVGGPNLIALEPTAGAAAIAFSIFNDVFANPCDASQGFVSPPPSPSVDGLASTLAGLPGIVATRPVTTTIAGYPATALTLTAPSGANGCASSTFQIWHLPLGAVNALLPGDTDRVWILNVGTTRLIIDADQPLGQTAQQAAEIQAILDSVTIAP